MTNSILRLFFEGLFLWRNHLEFIFLSQTFFDVYTRKDFPEILTKKDRPYCMLKVQIGTNTFAIPFRSNIKNNSNAFMTDKKNNCGIDFSKAVIVNDKSFIETKGKPPYIRPVEFVALKGQEQKIKAGMERFIKTYKKADKRKDIKRNRFLCKFSTLQYFHQELKINK